MSILDRIVQKTKEQAGSWQQNILVQLRSGKLLPVLSSRLCDDLLLGGHEQLIQAYADHCGLSLAGPPSTLPAVAQRHMIALKRADADLSVKADYLAFAKLRLLQQAEASHASSLHGLIEEEASQFDGHDFSVMAANLGLPCLDAGRPGQDPLLVLANFDLPVYLTTSPHCFLERALQMAGRQPRTEHCRWWPMDPELLPPPPSDAWQPSVQEPLVYHLHGLDSCPESLVLSEDDHLSFLVNFSSDKIPPRLRQALADSPLLLLGYDLAAWDFRTLFYGLVRKRFLERRRHGVCVLQLQPSQQEEERGLLDFYMEQARLKVVWDDFAQYLRQLDADLRR